jgi:hypothetical protein
MFKSVSGELSNLRWDVPLQELPSYWGKEGRAAHPEDWQLLADLTRGLAGGGPVPRCVVWFCFFGGWLVCLAQNRRTSLFHTDLSQHTTIANNKHSSLFIFDALDVPHTVNAMALQARACD